MISGDFASTSMAADGPIILALVNAVAAAVLLLEDCGDDEVDPDTAVRGMENIAACLLALDKTNQRTLRSHFLHLAEASENASYRSRLLSIPDSFGLA